MLLRKWRGRFEIRFSIGLKFVYFLLIFFFPSLSLLCLEIRRLKIWQKKNILFPRRKKLFIKVEFFARARARSHTLPTWIFIKYPRNFSQKKKKLF